MEKNNNHHNPERLGRLEGDALLRPIATTLTSETRLSVARSSDFVLQWGNRKRLRYMKIQVKDKSDSASDAPVHKTTVRVDRRVVRSDNSTSTLNQPTTNDNGGYLILRQRPSSSSHHILRNSESSIAMKGHGNGLWGLASPDRGGAQDNSTTVTNKSNHNDNYKEGGGGGGASESSETGHDSKKGGFSSAGKEAIPMVWPPNFVIALTKKEKEEDFMAIKGSKLPQRPKKRAKFIQRKLNLVSPGTWLCDLTLERYEVREKKISKKRPRGLKAMGHMDSDSE